MHFMKLLTAAITAGLAGLMADTSTAATWHVSPAGDDAGDYSNTFYFDTIRQLDPDSPDSLHKPMPLTYNEAACMNKGWCRC